jgi:hypothetical protein
VGGAGRGHVVAALMILRALGETSRSDSIPHADAEMEVKEEPVSAPAEAGSGPDHPDQVSKTQAATPPGCFRNLARHPAHAMDMDLGDGIHHASQ